jgi:F0F1-type ATP synthase epsilon subunit
MADLRVTPNKPVYEEHPELTHYTTADGPMGIVISKALWALKIGYG